MGAHPPSWRQGNQKKDKGCFQQKKTSRCFGGALGPLEMSYTLEVQPSTRPPCIFFKGLEDGSPKVVVWWIEVHFIDFNWMIFGFRVNEVSVV